MAQDWKPLLYGVKTQESVELRSYNYKKLQQSTGYFRFLKYAYGILKVQVRHEGCLDVGKQEVGHTYEMGSLCPAPEL